MLTAKSKRRRRVGWIISLNRCRTLHWTKPQFTSALLEAPCPDQGTKPEEPFN